jgi:alkanesulfonate monooxygenase SsuD/methylene tetrahydromethanopterin reductase-like flavin-dependent oxidoreductase (luciferase family)
MAESTSGSATCARSSPGGAAADAYAASALCGTPDQIIEKIAGIQNVLGSFQLIVLPSFGGMPYGEAGQSLELFAKEVLPAVQELQGSLGGGRGQA